MSDMLNRAEDYLKNHLEDLTKSILTLCAIPSPTGAEGQKAAFLLGELKKYGAHGAYTDSAGNVLYPYQSDKHEKVILYCAHMDTVFEGVSKLTPRLQEGRMYAPSAWDNSSGVAGLLLLIRMLLELDIRLPEGILFAFSVGEEGLGRLKGVRQIFADWGGRIAQTVAVDGSCLSFVNAGVGSRRYQVNVETAGGHSWKDFGGENAIAAAAGIIGDIYRLPVPQTPRTTYNVGVIRGGTTVNAIAARAEFLLDLRSEAESTLAELDEAVHGLIKRANGAGVKAHMYELGIRPCGGLGARTELEKRIMRIRAQAGLPTHFHASSTDANLPLSLGIPSLTFGIGDGDHAHTLNEYLGLSSLEGGILQLARYLLTPACGEDNGPKPGPYDAFPVYESESFLLRLVSQEDAADLLECYRDPESRKFFNADRCTSDFCYETPSQMRDCIAFWLEAYRCRGFARLSVVDISKNIAVGTVEIFGGDHGVLRLDLLSGYENAAHLGELLRLADSFFTDFGCKRIVTKAVPEASARISALEQNGYSPYPPSDAWSREHYYTKKATG